MSNASLSRRLGLVCAGRLRRPTLARLEQQAEGADLVLVFFAGHGMATEEGNILTPVNAKVNCATGAVTQGVVVERIMAATEPARMKPVILDECRDNPLGAVCPNLIAAEDRANSI